MRLNLIGAFVLLGVVSGPQRGVIDKLTTAARGETGATLELTVHGLNPCGAVEIDPGDGNVVTHPIVELPATVRHTYRRPGSYEIRARGMGNCDGQTTAKITVTGRDLTEPVTSRERVEDRRRPETPRRDAQPLSTRGTTVMVPADNRWTDTGIRVREGDALLFEASGSVTFAPRAADTGPEGSASARVRNAPFPDRPAGALIARIGDDGPPIFIGATERTLRAERSGVLWLGVNDDAVGDNRGRFRVHVSDARGTLATSGRRDRGTAPGSGDGGVDWDVRVRAHEAWTDTGIMLATGDVLQIEASGTVQLTQNASDTANPEGSRTRVASRAPFPNRPAGALLARIGQGEPLFVGQREHTIRVMESGRLWLGVNDDYFADNSGEFRVRISVRSERR